MPITHAFVSPKTDSTDTSIVRPVNWNADHVADIDLETEVSGVLPVDNGGMPEATTKGSIPVWNGSTYVVLSPPSEDGLYLLSASTRPEGIKWGEVGYSDWADESNNAMTDGAGNYIEFKD